MQRNNERDLISAWQSGSLPAAEAFVRQRQAEVRTIAYLLTLERNQARGLAEAAFVRFFQSTRTMDADTDTRQELLVRLGRLFLRKEFEAVEASQPDMFSAGPPQKYGVDNQRDRTLAALGRLEDRERIALVLGEVAAFDPSQINLVLERGNTALVAPMETGRQRLRQSLDIPQGQPVRPALLDASFDGPREDLWPELVDDISRIHREEQRRGQLVTYGVVAGMFLVALIAIIALFGNDLFAGEEDDPAALGDTSATAEIVEDISTPLPTVIPPTPTPTPEPLPLADVPNVMLAGEYYGTSGGLLRVTPVRYDTDTDELVALDQIDASAEPGVIVAQWITPDGAQLVVVRETQEEGIREYSVTVLDSGTLEWQWQASIGEFSLNPESSYSIIPPVTMSSDEIFVVRLDPDNPVMTVDRYDLDDGTQGESASIDINADTNVPDEYSTVSLFLTPDQSRLLIVVHDAPASNVSQPQAGRLVQLALPDLERVDESVQPFANVDDPFSIWGAALAVDGQTFYRVSNGEPGRPLQVDFLDIQTGARTAIMVPFANDENLPYRQITMFHSHDGYRMFLIDSFNGNVAVIHLTERRLERYFSIDKGEFGSLFGSGGGRLVFGWKPMLSQDGTKLYVPAGINTSEQRYSYGDSTGVWVIDLSTWTITDFWPIEGTVEGIYSELADGTIFVRSWLGEAGLEGPNYRLGRIDGELIREELALSASEDASGIWVTSLASLYRSSHGRSPAVNGVDPAALPNYSTLPRLETATENNIASGISTTITVRIFDPVSGNVLSAQREEVRFDPDSTVTVTLTRDGAQAQLLVMSQAEPGVYRADTALPADGTWDINVSIIAPDGTTTSVPRAGTLVVAPTLTGSDGERYQFRVRFDPRTPTVGEEAGFRIRLVNVDSGAVVSEDVTFDVEQAVLEGGTIEELPQRLSMSLGNPSTYFGSRSIIASQSSYGVWDGRITLSTPGFWTTAIRLQFAGMPLSEIPAGRVLVTDAE